MDSHQDIGKGKGVETVQGKDKGKEKKKDSSKPAEKASNTAISQHEQAADPGLPRQRLRLGFFVFYNVFIIFFLCLLFSYHIFVINDDLFLFFHIS